VSNSAPATQQNAKIHILAIVVGGTGDGEITVRLRSKHKWVSIADSRAELQVESNVA
jgi:hypothetical protein